MADGTVHTEVIQLKAYAFLGATAILQHNFSILTNKPMLNNPNLSIYVAVVSRVYTIRYSCMYLDI